MVNIVHALLSSICITIPEFIFMIIITTRIMKRKEMLDLYDWKNNLISILEITMPPALLYDTLSYIIKSSELINKILSFFILYILLIYVLKQRDKERGLFYPYLKTKAFFYLFVSLFLAIAIEEITLPIILKLVNRTVTEIKLDFYLVLLCSLTPRVLDIVIIAYIFIKRNSKFKINMIDYILKNKFSVRMIILVILGLIIFEGYFMKSLIYNNLLGIYSTIYEQLFIVIGVAFLIPGLIMIIIYSSINYLVIIINSGEKRNFRND